MNKRKPGQPHKGWKASAKKHKVSGVWRTGIPRRLRRTCANGFGTGASAYFGPVTPPERTK